MKRIVIMIMALGLALSACAKTTNVGEGLGCEGDECLESVPPTQTATPKPSPAKTKATPKATKKAESTTKSDGNTWEIVIKSPGDGYEPRERRVVKGDTIVFRNQDESIPEGHTFTGDGNEWNSGIVKAGNKWTWTVDLEPGTYYFHCETVPYIVGGPIEVLRA